MYKPGQKLEHYKGMPYQFLFYAKHSETLEDIAVYECLYENEGGKLWVRPKKMFEEKLPAIEEGDSGRLRFAPVLLEDGQPERLIGCANAQLVVAASRFNVRTWNYIDDWKDLSPEDHAECLEYAYAALALWRELDSPINLARGHWLVAFVLIKMGIAKLAELHVEENARYTEYAAENARDFDFAFSMEIQARLKALNRDAQAAEYKKAARAKGESIKDEKERAMFFKGFDIGPW